MKKIPWRRLDWTNTAFLIGTHLVALGGTLAYGLFHGFTWSAAILAVVFAFATSFSVTGGYHRLFAHRTYEGHLSVRLFHLLFGAAAYQNSALKWAADHRKHHQYVDEDQDPYNIKNGFWYAHIGWIFIKESGPLDVREVPDLAADPLVRWQHRWYIPLSIVMGFGLPLAIGWMLGDPIGGLVLAGFLRLVILHHAAFSVNSFAHTIGRQPYSNQDSSRDSFLTAIVSMGEGYHNFHHTFPYDYRNGVLPHQFDPTKWLIHGLHLMRLTHNLKRASIETIVKARLRMDALGLAESPWSERLKVFREKLEILVERWQKLKAEYVRIKAELGRRAGERLRALKLEIREARREFSEAWARWREALRRPEILAASA